MHQIAPGKPRNHAPHSNTDMDESLECIIRLVLEDARAAGRDYPSQSEEAVRAGETGATPSSKSNLRIFCGSIE